MIKSCILTGYGINADRELCQAFTTAGASAEYLHINDLLADPKKLDSFRILAFPGGFSFGDHLGSGLVLSNLLKQSIKEKLRHFVETNNLILGICNGFQVLVKMGLLPNMDDRFQQEVTLLHNDSGVFENSWVHVQFEQQSHCVWTAGLSDMDLPIRHGEGKFYAPGEDVLDRLEESHLVALRYSGRNPNGSLRDIAGITDRTGRILGLMSHPEAYIIPEQHPRRHRDLAAGENGLSILSRGVHWAETHGK